MSLRLDTSSGPTTGLLVSCCAGSCLSHKLYPFLHNNFINLQTASGHISLEEKTHFLESDCTYLRETAFSAAGLGNEMRLLFHP
ncbi:hypothetical protein GN956_G16378 [Arapaima gigas]